MARSATMTRPKAPVRPKAPGPDDPIQFRLTRRQVIAIRAVFDVGIRASEAHHLIANTSTAEGAMNDLFKQMAAA